MNMTYNLILLPTNTQSIYRQGSNNFCCKRIVVAVLCLALTYSYVSQRFCQKKKKNPSIINLPYAVLHMHTGQKILPTPTDGSSIGVDIKLNNHTQTSSSLTERCRII